MPLEPDEVASFYRLWYSLVWAVNEEHQVIPRFARPSVGEPVTVPLAEFAAVRTAMWDNPEWIDEYLDEQELADDEAATVAAWRRRFVTGRFIMVKHLARYSVLLPTGVDDPPLYGVDGLTESIADSWPMYRPPFLVDTVLLPFSGRIIYDSLAHVPPVLLGPGIRASVRDEYRQIKQQHGITVTL